MWNRGAFIPAGIEGRPSGEHSSANVPSSAASASFTISRIFRSGWQGHVGFYAGRTKNGDILVLGGNHGDAVSIRPYPASQLLGFRRPETVPQPPDVQPVAESGVVRGTAIAAASGGTIVAENLPALVSELGRADRHLQAGTILGVLIGLAVIGGAAHALWLRVKAAGDLREVAP